MQRVKKILLLEDDEFTRLLVQAQLQKAGFNVDSFTSYTDIATAIHENHHDLVVTDLHVDGHDPGELIKSLKADNSVPLVILSNSTEKMEGADLMLGKPLTPEKVKQIAGLLHKNDNEVDLSKVYQFACGDEELMISYVNTFIANYEKDLHLLKEEVNSGDVRLIKNRAHKMLSSVAYYGSQQVNELLQTLELRAMYMNKRELRELLDSLEMHSANLISKLQQKITA